MGDRGFIKTTHGNLAYEEHGNGERAVLFIHGNSSCRGVFRRQMINQLEQRYRLITFDLPGHGESDNSSIPRETYTMPGFADATLQLIESLNLRRPVIVGWSLGGHIAVELLSQYPQLRAMLLSGAPPIGKIDGRNDLSQAFKNAFAGSLAGKEAWSDKDSQDFVHRLFSASEEQFLVDAARRADGRFRQRLFAASAEGLGANQLEVIQTASIPLGVINGADDPVLNLDYFDSLKSHFWHGTAFRLSSAGHVPFWQNAGAFNNLFEGFLHELEERS
jgi:pimeloyl-ACP methyl ester carboxylesterase